MRTPTFVVAAVFCASCHGSSEMLTGPSTPAAPPASLNITGVVRDLLLQPIRDATVTIADGPSAGVSTATDARGEFALSAPTSSPNGTAIVIARDGYGPATTHVMYNGHVMIYLQDAAFAALAGSATLTLVADASCAQLPPSVRGRSYGAVLSATLSNAWAMKTALSGADFYDGLGSMFVGRNRDGLWFGVYSWDASERWLEEYPLAERLTRTSYLAIRGKATAPFPNSPPTFTVALDGTFSYCGQSVEPQQSGYPPTCAIPPVDCTSNGHRLTFTRP
jgi:hypothetical protein